MKQNLIKAKGDIGETEMNEWLMQSGLSYIAICQARESFSSLFNGCVKRPDFLVLLDAIGLISVDAKNLEVTEWDGIPSFTLSMDHELIKAITFERLFRLPLWYAYRLADESGTRWHWISAMKAVEVGTRRTGCNGEFVSIALKDFVVIKHADDMSKLYVQRMKSLSSVAKINPNT